MTEPDKKGPDITPPPAPNQQPTHLAVPTELVGSILEILQELPWKDSNRVIASLTQCQGIAVPDA